MNFIQYNTVKSNFKGPAGLLRFRYSFGFKKSKDMEKENYGLEISFDSSDICGLKVFGLTKLYCIKTPFS